MFLLEIKILISKGYKTFLLKSEHCTSANVCKLQVNTAVQHTILNRFVDLCYCHNSLAFWHLTCSYSGCHRAKAAQSALTADHIIAYLNPAEGQYGQKITAGYFQSTSLYLHNLE